MHVLELWLSSGSQWTARRVWSLSSSRGSFLFYCKIFVNVCPRKSQHIIFLKKNFWDVLFQVSEKTSMSKIHCMLFFCNRREIHIYSSTQIKSSGSGVPTPIFFSFFPTIRWPLPLDKEEEERTMSWHSPSVEYYLNKIQLII